MSNDRILRTLQQDVEIPEVVRKKQIRHLQRFVQTGGNRYG